MNKDFIEKIFHYCENVIYIVIALFLVITSIFLMKDVVLTFLHPSTEYEFLKWIVEILDKTLLMLMVIEILYTVRVSFKDHVLCAEPFLIVALIAAIRRILVISVESAYIHDQFQNFMVEMVILGFLTIIFVVSIIYLKKVSNH